MIPCIRSNFVSDVVIFTHTKIHNQADSELGLKLYEKPEETLNTFPSKVERKAERGLATNLSLF